MLEAEAKLLSNGQKKVKGDAPAPTPHANAARSTSPGSRSGSPAPREQEAEPHGGTVAGDMARALQALKGALERADGHLNDPRGRHWLGAHEPDWSKEPAWKVDPKANSGLRAALRPAQARREPWALTQHLAAASRAADSDASGAVQAAVSATTLPGRFWNDVGTRLVRRYASPPVVRPNPWAHEAELSVPLGAAGHRGVARTPTVVEQPVAKPPRPRAASTGRISLAFSSPQRNTWEVSLTMGASYGNVSTTGTLSKTFERVLIPQRWADPARVPGVPQNILVHTLFPRVLEKGHNAQWPRMVQPGKAAASVPVPNVAPAREPWALAVLRPRPEGTLLPEQEAALAPAWAPKPQRGPHKVRRKSGKVATMRVALPTQRGSGAPPAQPPGTQSADVQQRCLHILPPVKPETDVDSFVDADTGACSECTGPAAVYDPAAGFHLDVAPPAPSGPGPQRAHAPAPGAQVEASFITRDDRAVPRAGGKRWRARAKTERQVVSTKTIHKPRVRLTRWEAACIIQAHFRGWEARRMMSAIKARIMLSTHLVESRMAGVKGRGAMDTALPSAALRHVKVLAEAYEQSSHRPKFARAENAARQASSTHRALSAMPDRADANPLVRIYQTKGEAAAVEAAAKEALAWTNWMVPDLAKTPEDDATVAAVRAFKDMVLREGEPVSEARASADRISMKAAAEVVGAAMSELTSHGLSSDGYISTTATIANRLRDGKESSGEVNGGVKRPAWEREAYAPNRRSRDRLTGEQAEREAERDHFARSYENIQREHKLPTPPSTGTQARRAQAQAASAAPPRTPAAAPAPVAASAARSTTERPRWLDTAAALFGRNNNAAQQAAVVKLQSAVRRMRARRQLEVLRARADLRSAVSAVRERGIAGQPAVLDKTMALGDAYLKAWNLPRAEQCYSHVLDTMERDYGQGDARCIRPASALAQVYRRRGEPSRAADVMQRATTAPSKPHAKDPFSSAFGGLFGGGAAAPAAGASAPVGLAAMQTGSKVLDGAAAGVQDALANSTKAMQDQLGNLFGGAGWLSSRPTAAVQ